MRVFKNMLGDNSKIHAGSISFDSGDGWIKLPDGTLICYDTIVETVDIYLSGSGNSVGTSFRTISRQINLPQEYILSGLTGAYTVFLSAGWENAPNRIDIEVSPWERRVNHFKYFYKANESLMDQTVRLHWITVGRWK